MSLASLRLNEARLRNLLNLANTRDFLQLVWAVNALQSDHPEFARPYIRYPKEAETNNITDKFAVYKWELETLVNFYFNLDNRTRGRKIHRILDTGTFDSVPHLINALRAIENSQAGRPLPRMRILNEMHRIGQRQFDWQWGFDRLDHLFRFAYIYIQGDCQSYLEEYFSIKEKRFVLIGLVFYAAFSKQPFWQPDFDIKELGIVPQDVSNFLRIVSIPERRIRNSPVSRLGKMQPLAYQASVLREKPIIAVGGGSNHITCPLPALLVRRISAGLYYDMMKASNFQHLLNDANDRFEHLSKLFIERTISDFLVRRSFRYKHNKMNFDTPDLLIKRGGALRICIECKATKLTYHAQFSDDPIRDATNAYQQMAKGIFQLWRFFSHLRRGLLDYEQVGSSVHGIVLTLETWLVASPLLLEEVYRQANEMADNHSEIFPEDRRKIIICAAQHWEQVLLRADADSLLELLERSKEDKYTGFLLPIIQEEVGCREQRSFPFDAREVLPFWDDMKKIGWKMADSSAA